MKFYLSSPLERDLVFLVGKTYDDLLPLMCLQADIAEVVMQVRRFVVNDEVEIKKSFMFRTGYQVDI
jgi:hypothetical protein